MLKYLKSFFKPKFRVGDKVLANGVECVVEELGVEGRVIRLSTLHGQRELYTCLQNTKITKI